MLTEKEVLAHLDDTYVLGDYYQFIQLGHPYSYLIDSRLNVFKSGDDRWAIAAERLGYSDRAGEIELEIFYYGNCLINLDEYNNQKTNYYGLRKVDPDSFFATTEGPYLLPNAKCWVIGDTELELSVKQTDYTAKGIKLKEYEPGQIRVEEAARRLVLTHSHDFRATEEELYKSIPTDLKKILVLDEWHHKDFLEIKHPATSDEHLKRVYEFNRGLVNGTFPLDFPAFEALFRQQEKRNAANDSRNRNKKRPGSYETWQQLAKVIATGNISFYQPTLKPNTHWKNWPASGSL
jgi:hypothetical protein